MEYKHRLAEINVSEVNLNQAENELMKAKENSTDVK